jgi:hypothetical protein
VTLELTPDLNALAGALRGEPKNQQEPGRCLMGYIHILIVILITHYKQNEFKSARKIVRLTRASSDVYAVEFKLNGAANNESLHGKENLLRRTAGLRDGHCPLAGNRK